jgi:hypothetical protein
MLAWFVPPVVVPVDVGHRRDHRGVVALTAVGSPITTSARLNAENVVVENIKSRYATLLKSHNWVLKPAMSTSRGTDAKRNFVLFRKIRDARVRHLVGMWREDHGYSA